jgi:hypothetical protein
VLARKRPTGGAYVADAGSIAATAPAMTISPSTGRGIINCQGFTIGSDNSAQISTGAGETLMPMALALAYAADPAHPDVFSLKKGLF